MEKQQQVVNGKQNLTLKWNEIKANDLEKQIHFEGERLLSFHEAIGPILAGLQGEAEQL